MTGSRESFLAVSACGGAGARRLLRLLRLVRLAPIFRALAELDPGPFELVDLGMLTEARGLAAAATGEARDVLEPAIERALACLGDAPRRTVHGDSHPGNVLRTTDGPLWSD